MRSDFKVRSFQCDTCDLRYFIVEEDVVKEHDWRDLRCPSCDELNEHISTVDFLTVRIEYRQDEVRDAHDERLAEGDALRERVLDMKRGE